MSTQKNNIVNSQFVSIEQTPASIIQRIGAQIIDYIVLGVIYYVIAFINTSFNISVHAGETITIILMTLPLLYSPFCEQFFNGKTIGKAITGTRVVMLNGDSVSIGASILRWLFSSFEIYTGIALFTVLFNVRHQRLGDIAGGSIVISRNNFKRAASSLSDITYIKDDYVPTFPFAAELTQGQISFISKASKRVSAKDINNKKVLMNFLIEKYGIEDPKMYPFKFLKTVVRDYHYYMLHENV